MQNNAKCFIKIGKGIYEEITYEELEKRRKLINSYSEKKFIYIHGMLLEVTKSEYEEYYAEIERNRYCKKVLQKLQVVSIEKLNTNEDMNDKQVIADNSKDIELEIERKIEIEQLRNALLELDNDEYQLIKELFFKERTVREYAEIKGIPYATVQYKKKQALKKLKKFLKI